MCYDRNRFIIVILLLLFPNKITMIIMEHNWFFNLVIAVQRFPNEMFQKNRRSENNVFDIPYYQTFKKYLLFLGQYPMQSRWSQNFNATFIICSLISLLIPALSQFCASIIEKNFDTTMECVPILVTLIVSMIKLLNHKINKEKYDKLFELIKKDWELLKHKNQEHILDKVTKRGYVLVESYRTTLISFLTLFLFLPLYPLFLDVILPLNETRQQHQMFKLKYFVNEDDYFYPIYFHSVWCAFTLVIVIVCMDSLYMIIVHHNCGLFAVCGYRIIKATENNNISTSETYIERFRECVAMHHKAIQFYKIIDESSRMGYFFQILCNMIGITVTAVQTTMYLHQPEEALRIAIFLVAQQFHLLIITLPGQFLVDQSLNLANDIYCSSWYRMPMNVQQMLHMMQLRSSKVCKLTAGGLYELNVENFGTTFKTCMSYFTVLSSLKE